MENNNRALLLLSVAGSAASIFALVIVLLQEAADASQHDLQLVAWQSALAFAAIIGCGGFSVLGWQLVGAIGMSQKSQQRKTIEISLVLVATAILLGLCIDGFAAAISWKIWGWPLYLLYEQFLA